ncbi:39k protein [Cryptophlebia leucotreta granulovirus]|uniref:39k protein n=1 Tax=Cryptophlebia leucotreta granulosis virus TaxID=35254 RepID=Q7T5N4_GVCL|nr:39k protein [Cryptophlebia leucotreta granulovirus]AAQ21650.1 39k protein [Cryptophlebia leucotreta granulovirus]AUF82017.1 39K protein [Cryptophlebia leucotreta granulovirus]
MRQIDIDNVEVLEDCDSSPQRYTVNLKHVPNKDMTLVISFKAVDAIKKNVVKKKNGSPYMINSFIFYTSFLSKADIKLKKESKSWQLMGALDPVTKKPVDLDGYQFRKLIEGMEAFHKKLVVFEDEEHKIIDKDSTTFLRKQVIEYAKEMLKSYYCNENFTRITKSSGTRFSEIFVASCEELNKHCDDCNFEHKINLFKKFLERHDFVKKDDEVKILTKDMVNDE